MGFENFIFDLDGTLVDSSEGIQAAFEHVWALSFPNKSVPDIKPHIGPPIKEMFRTMLPTALESDILEYVTLFRTAYDTWGWQKTRIYDDVLPFLEFIKKSGCQCYGVTNKPAQPTKLILNALGIATSFITFMSPDLPGHPFRKKVQAFDYLLEEYHLIKKKTVAIGDLIEDAEAAYESEIAFIYRKKSFQIDDQGKFPIFRICSDLSQCNPLVGEG